MKPSTSLKPSVQFVNQQQSDFFNTLRNRVNLYFTENNITRYGNREAVVKAIILLGSYLGAFAAVLLLDVSAWLLLPFAVLMGISMAGIGMAVMHDALHGSYSRNTTVNKLLGQSLNFLGGSTVVWKIQHNVLHHTYTNIHQLDDDIETKAIVRLCKHAPIKHFYRFQHIYVFFAYGLMTLLMIVTDFIKLAKYHQRGMVEKNKVRTSHEFIKMSVYKCVYLFLMIGLPLLITGLAWWQVLTGFLVVHLVAGYILSVVFQMAHIVEGTEQPLPSQAGTIENSWAVHQLLTTANFSKHNRFLSWYTGGLNFQIEHHLFPNICHVHYRKIADIVQKTAEEYELPYNLKPTFMHALQSHLLMLKSLGRESSAAH